MPEPTRWRKKPVVIEAMHYPPEPTVYDNARLHRWVSDNGGRTNVIYHDGVSAYIVIVTLEGDMRVNPGDWIIRGVVGEFYPCEAGVFAKTYEPAGEKFIDWGRSERMDGSDSPRRVHTPTPDGWTAVQVQVGSKRGHTIHASKRAAEKDARRLAKMRPNVEVWVCPVINGAVIWPGGTR